MRCDLTDFRPLPDAAPSPPSFAGGGPLRLDGKLRPVAESLVDNQPDIRELARDEPANASQPGRQCSTAEQSGQKMFPARSHGLNRRQREESGARASRRAFFWQIGRFRTRAPVDAFEGAECHAAARLRAGSDGKSVGAIGLFSR